VSDQPLNFVDLLVAAIAIFAGREIAHLVGPYVAIICLAIGGASIALAKSGELNAIQSLRYVSLRVLLAVGLTVGAAEILQELIPWAKPRYTLMPLAFAIGWCRDYGEAWTWLWTNCIARFLPKGTS